MPESQRVVLLVFSALSGLVVGSFLNVCIFRLPRNCMSIVRPRSRCPRCLRPIAWYDNLPVVSWIVLGGRCRGCGLPISPRYPLVELLTGALFFAAAWPQVHGADPAWPRAVTFAVHAAFLSSLLVCTFIDLEFQILPDEITVWGTALGLALSAAFPFLHPVGLGDLPLAEKWVPAWLRGRLEDGYGVACGRSLSAAVLGAAAGSGFIYAVGVFGKICFRKRIEKLGETEAMGFGDVKYMAMIGAVLGPYGVIFTFGLGALLGAVFGILKLIVLRRMGYAPFGPFLSAGALTVLLWKPHVSRALGAFFLWMNRLMAPLADWIYR